MREVVTVGNIGLYLEESFNLNHYVRGAYGKSEWI